MLRLHREGNTVCAETMGGRLVWDARCGGQISKFAIKNELSEHSLLPESGVLPDLRIIADGDPIRLSSVQADLRVVEEKPDCAKITATARLCDGTLTVSQEYEIHEEGALFCNLAMETESGKSFDLSDCSLNPSVDTRGAGKMRWGYYLRQTQYKRDYSTVHAFTAYNIFLDQDESADERALLPYLSVDLGWEDTRFFSNHIEFLLEDWTSYNDGPLTQTRTKAGKEEGIWRAHWHFHEGSTVRINGPYRYRNRWGMLFGRARTRSGADADPALRNNALGSRICHCMYPYARAGDQWPWVSMPIKQIPEQPPQFFEGNPELSRADEARDLGADTMIIHQFWMRNPGSNNEPVADYRPHDPEWLRAFTNRCHELDMRVAYYVRGTEMWQEYSSFFDDFLQKDRDGMYADWNTPFCMGYVKCSPLHVSAHNYFHFTKALRRRVGGGGVLIGHCGNANLLACACFDAAVGGEFSVRHDQLLTRPESSAYYAQVNSMGAHLISGNLPDRIAFSSPKAAAICAALGMASHPFMEPGVEFSERVAFIKPLWDAMNSLPGRAVRLHNPAYIPTRAVGTEAEHLYPSLWQSDSGKALLLVTNMAEDNQSGVVELDIGELDVAKNATVRPLAIDGCFAGAEVDGRTVRLNAIPSLKIAALLIE